MEGVTRYQAVRSTVELGAWRVFDTKTGLNVRRGGAIRRFPTKANAEQVADQLNTAKVICRSCRHKVLAADTKDKTCLDCLAKGLR